MTIDRRFFLQGMGSLIAVPFLPSLYSQRAQAASSKLGYFFALAIPHGSYMLDAYSGTMGGLWHPPRAGAIDPSKIPACLLSLKDLYKDLNCYAGYTNTAALHRNFYDFKGPGLPGGLGSGLGGSYPSRHPIKFSTTLSACAPRCVNGKWITPATEASIDQVLADEIKKVAPTALHSLAMNPSPARGPSGSLAKANTGLVWGTNVSFRKNSPVETARSAGSVFDSLKSIVDKRKANVVKAEVATKGKSELDYVLDSVQSFKRKTSAADGAVLDGFLERLREKEKMAQDLDNIEVVAQCRDLPAVKGAAWPSNGSLNQANVDLVNYMIDVTALAFECGIVRVGTMGMGCDSYYGDPGNVVPQSLWYRNVKPNGGIHLDISHHGSRALRSSGDALANVDETKLSKMIGLQRWKVSFAGRLAQQLAKTIDPFTGDRLLDRTLITIVCGDPNGNHDGGEPNDMPLATLGGKALGIKTGQCVLAPKHIAAAKLDGAGESHASLYLTLLHKMGFTNISSFGQEYGKSTRLMNI